MEAKISHAWMIAMAQGANPRPRRWSKGAVISLVICLFIAGVSRLPNLGAALTADEVWMLAGSVGHGRDIGLFWKRDVVQTALISPTDLKTARPVQEIWTNNVEFHPPLHSQLLRLWRELIGGSGQKARAYSMAWSFVTIGMIFAALRLQFNSLVATCAALILALSPLQSHLSTEVRSYPMVIAFMSIAAWLVVRIETLGVTRWQVWSLGLLCLPMMLSHYFASGPCLAIAIWGLWRLRGRMRLNFLMAVAVAAGLFLTLWVPFAWRDVSELDGNEFLISHDPMKRFQAIANLGLLKKKTAACSSAAKDQGGQAARKLGHAVSGDLAVSSR
jgi:hypothetical protein